MLKIWSLGFVIRIEDDRLYLFQFSFYFYFILSLFSMLGDLGLRLSMITQSYGHNGKI